MLLVRDPTPGMPRLRVRLEDKPTTPPLPDGSLSAFLAGNAMAPMLPLFESLALRRAQALIGAGNGRTLRIDIAHD